MTREDVGYRIRVLRDAHCWTQAELGARLNPPRSHAAVSDIERGKTGLDIEEMSMVAGALNTALDGLLTFLLPPDKSSSVGALERRVEELERQMRNVQWMLGPVS